MSLDETRIIREIRAGKRPAADLYPIIHAELRRVAAWLMRGERPNHTLQATVLADEAFLRLIGADAGWTSPRHFIALAAQCMRQILVDHARHKKRKKRGGGNDQPRLDSALEILEKTSGWSDSEALDAALRRLGEIQPRAAQMVQMRFFGELTMEQIAVALDCSMATIERDWRYARAWLRKRLSDEHG